MLSYSESLDFCVFFLKKAKIIPMAMAFLMSLCPPADLFSKLPTPEPPCPEAYLDTALILIDDFLWWSSPLLSSTMKWHWLFSLTLPLKKKAVPYILPAFPSLLPSFYSSGRITSLSLPPSHSNLYSCVNASRLFPTQKFKFLMSKPNFALGHMPSIKSMACHRLFSVSGAIVWMNYSEWLK